MLITQQQVKEYERQHILGMGKHNGDWVTTVVGLMRMFEAVKLRPVTSVLDYGCGHGEIGSIMRRDNLIPEGVTYHEYDPGVPEKSALPEPADLVICTDVLEHIEPDLIDNVIQHLCSVTKIVAFIVVCMVPSKRKTLTDGRNVHLILESPKWWMKKLSMAPWHGIFLPSHKAGKYANFLFSTADRDYR